MTDRSADRPESSTLEGGDPTPERGRVVVLSTDLFFGMRIRTALRQLGFTVVIVKEAASFVQFLAGEDGAARLGIVDFNYGVDWDVISGATGSETPILAFGPHKDVEGFRAAKMAGVTRVVSNGEFTRSLPDLALRYARTNT